MSYALGVGPLDVATPSLEQLAKQQQDALVDSLPLPSLDTTTQVLPELVSQPKLTWAPFVIAGLLFWFLGGNRKMGRGSSWL